MRLYKNKKSLLNNKTAYGACLRKLNYKDYSMAEFRDFLSEQDLTSNEINELLICLSEYNYINDRRYAQMIYESWCYSHKGKGRLLMKLAQHKIDPEVIEYFAQLPTDEQEINSALILIEKYMEIHNSDIKENKQKIISHLKNKGFSWHVISAALAKTTS